MILLRRRYFDSICYFKDFKNTQYSQDCNEGAIILAILAINIIRAFKNKLCWLDGNTTINFWARKLYFDSCSLTSYIISQGLFFFKRKCWIDISIECLYLQLFGTLHYFTLLKQLSPSNFICHYSIASGNFRSNSGCAFYQIL